MEIEIGPGGLSRRRKKDEDNESKTRPRNHRFDDGRTSNLDVRQPDLQSTHLRQRGPRG